MNKIAFVLCLLCLCLSCAEQPKNNEMAPKKVRLMTLDPGHFHAALIQKTMYDDVDSTVHIFAPNGPEVKDFLDKIASYNSRANEPTKWTLNTHFGNDYLKKMITDKPGNVMVVAGKNSKKIDYILAAVKSGLNVYADKPLVINEEGFQKLEEITTSLQKQLSLLPEVFGTLVDGTVDQPAISKESVHHFFKYVSGQPLVRPPWFFDVNEEGEGIVDVTTHLVDLVQWEAFPGQIIKREDVEMLKAKRWATILTQDDFNKVTKLESFPDYLKKDVKDGLLNVFCNGEMNYKIKGKHAKVSVIWNFQAPEGTGDTHNSIMRGTKSDLIIRQGEDEHYKPTLYIESKGGEDFEKHLNSALSSNGIAKQIPGMTIEKLSNGIWKAHIPDELKIGHEAHFGQVTQNYLSYLELGALPTWEIPNMITKYYTTIEGYKMAKNRNSN
jgi:predicted dehydrogenase